MATFGSRNPLNNDRLNRWNNSVFQPPRKLELINKAPQILSNADVSARFEKLLIGQAAAGKQILPYVQMYQAGLSPECRPAGVFLLLGPTGTGKTRTVEALAESLHGSGKNVLRVDCGEYQMEHEVAKLIGAPPGYLGHRETQPLLSQARVQSVASESSSLSILLFDEIEKAAPSMMRMLLGVLDRGILRLGDNNVVNLEKTMIFLTSNLGAETMQKELAPKMGFAPAPAAMEAPEFSATAKRLESIGLAAAKKRFSPEFMNRIDGVITYTPLDEKAMDRILALQLEGIQKHLDSRLGASSFELVVTPKLKRFLLAKGVSREYGARELKRTLQRYVLQPLASAVTSGKAQAGCVATMDLKSEEKILIRLTPAEEEAE
jgi:ATP-dependent Clp protease ATP-binding subunit ClpA